MGSWWSTAIGAGSQLASGYLADREARRRQESQNDLSRDLAGSRGWTAADPLLGGAVSEAQRIYDERIAQGPYSQNVRRPSGQGSSAGQNALAGRAQELALGGPGQAGQAGLDYATRNLGGPGAAGLYGTAATMAQNLPGGAAGGMYQSLFDRTLGGGESPYTGQAAGMYGQAFDTAASGSNQYLDPLFQLASGMAGGGGGGGVYNGGFGGGGSSGNAGRVALDPNRFDIDLDDPRFHVNPEGFAIDVNGNLIGAPEALDSQGYVGEMLGENAPVGAAASLAALIADPFARSNPQLEEMIRLQQEDLQRSHEADLGRLNAAASGVGAYGGSDFQLARSQMAGELGRNVERASTGLRYDDYNRRLEEQMQALGLGANMDMGALAQAAQLEIFNRTDITDREKANLSAQLQRELANQGTAAGIALSNQGTQAGLAQGNQGVGAGIYTTEAELNNRAAIAGADRSAASAANARSIQAQQQQAALSAMLGVAGLQNDQQLGRLGLMGDYAGGMGNIGLQREGLDLSRLALGGDIAGGMGNLEQAGLSGMLGAAGGLGNLELGTLSQIPALEGIEMNRLGQAYGLASDVQGRNARASAAQSQYDRDAMLWDYERQSNALSDLINQGLGIGSHITTPTGIGGDPSGGYGGGGGAFNLGGLLSDPQMLQQLFQGGGGVPAFAGSAATQSGGLVTSGGAYGVGPTGFPGSEAALNQSPWGVGGDPYALDPTGGPAASQGGGASGGSGGGISSGGYSSGGGNLGFGHGQMTYIPGQGWMQVGGMALYGQPNTYYLPSVGEGFATPGQDQYWAQTLRHPLNAG